MLYLTLYLKPYLTPCLTPHLARFTRRVSLRRTSTAAAARPLVCGAQISPRGLALLRRFEPLPSHAEQSLREIERAVWRQVRVPLSANQFAALVSFAYSMGESGFRRSPLLHHLNAGRYQAAAVAFCTHPCRRRAAEQQLFLSS